MEKEKKKRNLDVFLGKSAVGPSLVSKDELIKSLLHLLTARIHFVDYHRLSESWVQCF